MTNTKERIATAQWVLERQLAWVAAAEVKVAVVVSLDVAMLGGLAAAFGTATSKTAWIYLFAVAATVTVLIALACAAYSVQPRLDGPKQSMLFFGRIQEVERADYIDQFSKLTDESILSDWSEQIHRNAEIAYTKHKWVSYSIRWSFLGLLPWVGAVSLLAK